MLSALDRCSSDFTRVILTVNESLATAASSTAYQSTQYDETSTKLGQSSTEDDVGIATATTRYTDAATSSQYADSTADPSGEQNDVTTSSAGHPSHDVSTSEDNNSTTPNSCSCENASTPKTVRMNTLHL